MFSELEETDSDVLGAPKQLKLVSSELTSLRISWADDFNEKTAQANYQVSYYRFDKHFYLIILVASLISFADKTLILFTNIYLLILRCYNE